MLVNDDNVDDHKDNKCFERNNKNCQKITFANLTY